MKIGLGAACESRPQPLATGSAVASRHSARPSPAVLITDRADTGSLRNLLLRLNRLEIKDRRHSVHLLPYEKLYYSLHLSITDKWKP